MLRSQAPEISLLTAMLEDAFCCVEGWVRGVSPDQIREAHEWFTSDRRDWPFSFLNICDLLEMDAAAIRRRLGAGHAVEDLVQV
jgi:hypothetical protein